MNNNICGLQKSIDVINPISHTLEEELRLGEIIQAGGEKAEKAKWDLVLGYTNYFVKCIRSICHDEQTQADMLQETFIYAHRASKSFDPTKGLRFKALISRNLIKELLCYKATTFSATKSSADIYKLIYKYNQLNNGREFFKPLTAEEFAEEVGISLDKAKDIVFRATNNAKNIDIAECYKLEDRNDSEDGEYADSYSVNPLGNYVLKAGKEFDNEVTRTQLDSYLDKILDNDEKKYVWMNHLGINGVSKTCRTLGEEIGKSEGAVRHQFERTNAIVMDNMPTNLYIMLRSYLAA